MRPHVLLELGNNEGQESRLQRPEVFDFQAELGELAVIVAPAVFPHAGQPGRFVLHPLDVEGEAVARPENFTDRPRQRGNQVAVVSDLPLGQIGEFLGDEIRQIGFGLGQFAMVGGGEETAQVRMILQPLPLVLRFEEEGEQLLLTGGEEGLILAERGFGSMIYGRRVQLDEPHPKQVEILLRGGSRHFFLQQPFGADVLIPLLKAADEVEEVIPRFLGGFSFSGGTILVERGGENVDRLIAAFVPPMDL